MNKMNYIKDFERRTLTSGNALVARSRTLTSHPTLLIVILTPPSPSHC